MEIERIEMELEQSKKNITTPVVNIVLFGNFLKYAWAAEDDPI